MIDEEEAAAQELEEERIREMEKMMEGEDEEEDEDEEGDDENGLNKSQASILTGRPMSGKEARQQRFSQP